MVSTCTIMPLPIRGPVRLVRAVNPHTTIHHPIPPALRVIRVIPHPLNAGTAISVPSPHLTQIRITLALPQATHHLRHIQTRTQISHKPMHMPLHPRPRTHHMTPPPTRTQSTQPKRTSPPPLRIPSPRSPPRTPLRYLLSPTHSLPATTPRSRSSQQ